MHIDVYILMSHFSSEYRFENVVEGLINNRHSPILVLFIFGRSIGEMLICSFC